MPPRVEHVRYSVLVERGLRDLTHPGGDPAAAGSLALACNTFERALVAEPPGGGELKAAMQAVAAAAPGLTAAVQAAETGAELQRFASLMELLSLMLGLVQLGGGPDAQALAAALCPLALELAGAPGFAAALAAPEQRKLALPLLALASQLLRQAVATLAVQIRAGTCSTAPLLQVLDRWRAAVGSLRQDACSGGLARAALLAARQGFFLALETVHHEAAFAGERAALGAPEEQQRYAAAVVAVLDDLLAHPPAADQDPASWADCLWAALQQAERPLWKHAMYDCSQGAAGMCCPGRAQQMLDAALQLLTAAPLARPASVPPAAHLQQLATLSLAVYGLADWALPQWAQAEAAGASGTACACCGAGSGACSSACSSGGGSKKKGKNKNKNKRGKGVGGGGVPQQRQLPQPPTHEALLAALRSIPAGARVISAALEEHCSILASPDPERGEDGLLASLQLSWAAKACVRMGYILRSHACTGPAVGHSEGACAWRTAGAAGGSSDATLAAAGAAAAEALVRLGGRLAQGGVAPPRSEAEAWAQLPTKALHYAEHLLEPTLRRVRLDGLAPTPALHRAALGLTLSMPKVVLDFVRQAAAPPRRGPNQRRQPPPPPQQQRGATEPPPASLLGRLLSAICFDAFFVLAPTAGREGSDDEASVFPSDEEAMTVACAALSLDHAVRALLPMLLEPGEDAEETMEGILGPMLTGLDMLAGLGGTGAALEAERALGRRPCANLDCANLAGASEFDLPSQRCSGCRTVVYCQAACQAQAWPGHRRLCPHLQAHAARRP